MPLKENTAITRGGNKRTYNSGGNKRTFCLDAQLGQV